MKQAARNSILVRSTVILLVSFFVAASLTISATIIMTGEREHRAATERLHQLLDTVESTVSVACFVRDAKLAEDVVRGLMKNKEVFGVTIRADAAMPAQAILADTRPDQTDTGMRLIRDVRSPFDANKVIGQIVVAANTEAINREIHDEVVFITIQIIVQLAVIAMTVLVVMLMFIVRPIKAMSDGLHAMDPTQGERLAKPANHNDSEIGRLVDDINQLAGNLVSALDQERSLRQEMEIGERKYHAIFENAETGIFIVTPEGQLTSYNPAFARLMGISHHDAHATLDLRELPWENPSHINQLTLNCQKEKGGLATDLAYRTRDGIQRWLNVVLAPIGDGQLQGVVHDITDHMEAEAQARRQAITDPLTGVLNRLGLEDRLERLMDTANGDFALVLVDLDNFRRINEGYGLPVGDSILKDCVNRLNHCIKASDTLARLGSDRFALVLPRVNVGRDLERIIERIQQAIRQPFSGQGQAILLKASLAVTAYPDDGITLPQLLRNAELALDRAKRAGGNMFVLYNPELAIAAEQRQQMESDLRQALKNDQFVLFYQPIVDLADSRLSGAEALIRWQHPRLGLVAPDAFIPLAEEIGLISEIGLWALDTACQQLAAWHLAGKDIYLSINVSGRQIPEGLPPDKVREAVDRYGIVPARLALEITEGVLLADVDKALAWLTEMRSQGFRIYLDDFGTGYSSLSYLKRFPIDTLKIDKSFVRDMNQDGSDHALIEAVVAMALGLDMTVVAEGVENAGQLNSLRAMRCHYVQGYYFSRPVPAAEFEHCAERVTEKLIEAIATT